MSFFRKKAMRKIVAGFSSAVLILSFSFQSFSLPSFAGTFTHVHNDSCYTQVKKTCTKHYTDEEHLTITKHCVKCGTMRECSMTYYWDQCDNHLIDRKENGWEIYCNTCGYCVDSNHYAQPQSHDYYELEMTCGLQEGQGVATVSAYANESGWTSQPVLIGANVNIYAAGFALASEPYSINGKAYSNSSTGYVYSNGTYSVSVKDAYGRVITENVTVSKIDATTPSLECWVSPSGWTNKSVTVTASASDSQSGVKGYCLDGTNFTSTNSWTISQNGNHAVCASDNVGNVTTKGFEVSNIDKDAPMLSLSKSTSEWTGGGVLIKASASDERSGVAGYSFNGGGYGSTDSWTVNSNGNYSVSVKDNAGNVTTKSISVTSIDRTAPTLSLSLNTKSWTKGNVVISASASDGESGVSGYSFNGGSYGSTGSFSVSENGTYEVSVRDKAGNTASKSIAVTNIDKTAPSVSLSSDNSSWTNGSVKVTANGSDGQSGIAGYSFNGGSFGDANSIRVSENGTVSATARDNVGNEKTASITISNIDKIAPRLSLSVDKTAWTGSEVTLSASGSDGQSGIAGYGLNGGAITATNSWKINKNGTYSVVVRDKAGNENTQSMTISNIDNVAPNLSVSADRKSWTKGNVVLTATADDGQSGIAGYSFNGGSFGAATSWTVSDNGTYAITAKDKAGNEKTVSVTVSNIDKINPTVSLSADTSTWTNTAVLVKANGSDGQSGISGYSFNGGAFDSNNTYKVTANGTVTVVVRDNVGNEKSAGITISNIDKTAPNLLLDIDKKGWTNSGVTITAGGSDAQSGLAGYGFSGGSIGTSNSWKVEKNGTYEVVAKDKAGNEKKQSITISNIDITPPIVSLSEDKTGWTNESIILTANAKDSQSGLASEAYSFNGGGYTSSNARMASKNGTYLVEVKDNAGNIGTASIEIKNIDTTAPTFTLSKSSNDWSENGITIFVNAQDSQSGLAENAYSFNGSRFGSDSSWLAKKNGTYSIQVKDKAGNIATQSITIDKAGKDPAIEAAEKAEKEKAEAEAAAQKAAAKEAERLAKQKAEAEESARKALEKAEKEANGSGSVFDGIKETVTNWFGKNEQPIQTEAEETTDNTTQSDNSETSTKSTDNSKTVVSVEKSKESSIDVTKKQQNSTNFKDFTSSEPEGEIMVTDVTSETEEPSFDETTDEKNKYINLVKADATGGPDGSNPLGTTNMEAETDGPAEDLSTSEELLDVSVGQNPSTTGIVASLMGSRVSLYLGCLLLVVALTWMSTLNYVYQKNSKRIFPISACRLIKEDGVYFIEVSDKIHKKREYNIFISVWNKRRLKNQEVYVRFKNDENCVTELLNGEFVFN